MISTEELISAAESLPLDIKTELIDRLFKSLNPSQKGVDELWAEEAEIRVEDVRSGKVEPIPGDEVFREIKEMLSR